MFRNLLSIGLSCVLLLTTASHLSTAQSQTVVHTPQTDRIATRVAKLGRGRRIKVKLTNNESLKGVLGEIGEDRFTLINPNTHTVTSISFDKVHEVKNNEPNQWKFAAITAAVVGGIMVMVALSLRGS
jgi:hypothetical protein